MKRTTLFCDRCGEEVTQKRRARITLNGELISLGLFNTEEDAALAYNRAAVECFGEFANLNRVGG